MLVDRIDVNTSNIKSNESVYTEYNIPTKLIEEIEKTIAQQNVIGNKDLTISIFAPSRSNNRQIDENTAYYSFQGYNFRDYTVKYWHMSTGMIESTGSNAKDVASAFFNLILSAVGVSNTTISIFGIGISALSAYEALHGTVVYGTQNDHIYTNVIYDKITKQTDIDLMGYWQPGCTSHKVWLDTSETYQYYSYIGQGELISKFLNVVYYSENFNSAAETTIANTPTPYYDFAIMLRVHSADVCL